MGNHESSSLPFTDSLSLKGLVQVSFKSPSIDATLLFLLQLHSPGSDFDICFEEIVGFLPLGPSA